MAHNDDMPCPYLGIFMVSYNHEKYIEQAIESVMMQETTFTYKLFIGEDCSTDNTRQVCLKMKQKYADRIDLNFNEKNLGSSLNVATFFQKIKTSGIKYAAILDGDDYWVDKNKIQKQVDILNQNTDCSICFSNAFVLNENTGELLADSDPSPVRTGLKLFLDTGKPRITCTSLLRADLFPNPMPGWFSKILKQDWAIFVMLIAQGDAYYLNDITSVYRVHGGGLIKSTAQVRLEENSVFLVENLLQYFAPKHQQLFGQVLTWNYFHLAFIYLDQLKVIQFLKTITKAAAAGERKTAGWYWLVINKAAKLMLKKILRRK
jgi:glycosyltransferase involved in cell wall biosynthesis